MADIVDELVSSGIGEDEVCEQLGMEHEEVTRLLQRGRMVERGRAPEFGQSWEALAQGTLMKPERELERIHVEDLFAHAPRIKVVGAPALGYRLLTNGHLGADLLVVEPDSSFPPHVHPGDHLLYIIEGWGAVTYGGVRYTTKPGDLVLIPGDIDHAVSAGWNGQTIMAIGAPHKAVDDPERMTEVDSA